MDVLRNVEGEQPEAVDEFITAWISALEGAEKLAASLAVSSLYVLDASIQTLKELQREFADYAEVANSPDASFDTGFAETLQRIATGLLEQAAIQLQ